MLSINRLLILPQWQLPSSPWVFINHYRWCGHHVWDPGVLMFRIAKLYYSLWTIFLPVLICFLSTPLLRQKKHIWNSIYASWNVLSPFISVSDLSLFLCCSSTFSSSPQKQTTDYWMCIWLLKHHFKIHGYSAQLMQPISEEKAFVGPIFETKSNYIFRKSFWLSYFTNPLGNINKTSEEKYIPFI